MQAAQQAKAMMMVKASDRRIIAVGSASDPRA
jgi:hypothetical protein